MASRNIKLEIHLWKGRSNLQITIEDAIVIQFLWCEAEKSPLIRGI